MNKHVLGAVVFSAIVGSFAVAYSLLFPAPIPELPPIAASYSESRVERCRRGMENANSLSIQILSSNLLVSEEKIVSKIVVRLAPGAEKPSRIFVQTRFTDSSDLESAGFGKYEVIENPFEFSRERLVTVSSPANTLDENLYLKATVGLLDPSASRRSPPALTQTKAVLAIFGKTSDLPREDALPYPIDPDQTLEVPVKERDRSAKQR